MLETVLLSAAAGHLGVETDCGSAPCSFRNLGAQRQAPACPVVSWNRAPPGLRPAAHFFTREGGGTGIVTRLARSGRCRRSMTVTRSGNPSAGVDSSMSLPMPGTTFVSSESAACRSRTRSCLMPCLSVSPAAAADPGVARPADRQRLGLDAAPVDNPLFSGAALETPPPGIFSPVLPRRPAALRPLVSSSWTALRRRPTNLSRNIRRQYMQISETFDRHD